MKGLQRLLSACYPEPDFMAIAAKLLLFSSLLLLAACASASPDSCGPAPIPVEAREGGSKADKQKGMTPDGGSSGQAAGKAPGAEKPAGKAGFTAVPVPFVATTPNEGTSYGALAAFLLYNRQGEITKLVAPQVNYNRNFGYTGTLYGAFYPKPERQLEVNLSQSTIINQDYDVRFRDKTLLDNKLETKGYAGVFADGSARFFGFQSESRRRNQTNYTDRESGLDLSAGYDIVKHFQVALGDRVRDVSIGHGALTGLPFIGSRFTENQVPGVNGFTAHVQRVAFIYDSMDSRITPTSGLYGRAIFETSNALLGSIACFQHYEVEAKGYLPLYDARSVTVARFAYNQVLGSNVPFLEQSALGGENTLRGYGRNRFIDNSFFLGNVEERIRLGRLNLFDVDAELEAAPFLDAGTVMRDIWYIRRRNFKYNPGIGFRGIVRPNIVGRVDMGVGQEGIAIFAGLGYPF